MGAPRRTLTSLPETEKKRSYESTIGTWIEISVSCFHRPLNLCIVHLLVVIGPRVHFGGCPSEINSQVLRKRGCNSVIS